MPQRYFLDQQHNFLPSDIHHILHVMRMKTNDQVIVCFDKNCYISQLKIESQDVTYEIIKKLEDKTILDITVIQGLPKGQKSEYVVKSATLFGAKRLIFVPMQRSIAKPENIAHKIKRYQSIAK